MGWLKPLERAAKYLLARALRPAFWRPGRRVRARAQLQTPTRVLLVRIDRRVGEALLMTPLMEALRAHLPTAELAVLVHPKVARLLEGHPARFDVLTLEKAQYAWGPLSRAVRALRRRRFEVVVNCANWEAPSVSSAIVSRTVGPEAAVVGPAVPPAGGLADVQVAPLANTRSERLQRLHLLSALGVSPSSPLPSFRVPRPGAAVQAALAEWGTERPVAVVNPGGRLGWRRVPPRAFAAAARALLAQGFLVTVTWGPGEEPLAREVLEAAPGAQLSPPTDLDDLAALLRRAQLSVCNNTGPMHLSVAVGTPTCALFLHMPIDRWGYFEAPHRMLDVTPWAQSEGLLLERVDAEVSAFSAGVLGGAGGTRSGTPSRTG